VDFLPHIPDRLQALRGFQGQLKLELGTITRSSSFFRQMATVIPS
jgi:hypothetical protein